MQSILEQGRRGRGWNDNPMYSGKPHVLGVATTEPPGLYPDTTIEPTDRTVTSTGEDDPPRFRSVLMVLPSLRRAAAGRSTRE